VTTHIGEYIGEDKYVYHKTYNIYFQFIV